MTFPQSTPDDHDELSFGESGYLRIPMRIAERYLTADTENEKAEVQAIGTHIQILIRSERQDMLMRIPTSEWISSKAYSRSLTGWTINLQRWQDKIETENGHVSVYIYTQKEY